MENTELSKLLNKSERSQAWLSRKLDYSAMAVCKWVNGQVNIPKEQAEKIRNLLK